MSPRRGFSLLELVLAIGLAVALAALLGSAINLHLIRLDSSRTTVERAQLARSILDQIADDLRAATTAPEQDVSELMQAAEAAAQFNVDEIDQENDSAESAESPDESPPTGILGLPGSIAIDRRQVRQSLATTPDTLVPTARLTAGWSRVEYSLSADSSAPGLVRRESSRDAALWRDEQGGVAPPAPPLAGEVLSLRFRYFDGTEFLPEWDMTEQQALPAAVEILIELASAEADDPMAPLTRRKPKAYRRVVRLPAAAEERSGEANSSAGTSSAGTSSAGTSATGEEGSL